MAEVKRRKPRPPGPRPDDADAFRGAWAGIEQLWTQTVEHSRRVPPDYLHERVNGEWSFVETLRHLVFVTDAWVKRALLGIQAPYDPLGLPNTAMKDDPMIPRDLDARPSVDEVLALRADRMTVVRGLMVKLTDEALTGSTGRVSSPGYPRPGRYPVRRCLQTVVNEEWHHRLYAERDLALPESRARRLP